MMMMKTEIEFSNFRITVLKALTKHDLKQIFERYYRVTITKNVRGTGLGMAISRDINEAHGGNVILSSKVGIGTTVEIHLSE